MTKLKLCASNPWSKQATGASAHFERIYTGQPEMPRTPLYKSKTTQEILNSWLSKMKPALAKYPNLLAYELTRVEKFGPRGGYPPWSKRAGDLELYASRLQPVNLNDPRLLQAVQDARKLLGIDKMVGMRPLSPERVLNRDIDEDKVNSNSGAPDFSKRKRPEVQAKAVSDAKSGIWETYPYVIGERTQRHGKTRFIFMAPMSSNLREKGYLVPLQDRLRAAHHPELLAWEGFDEVESYGPNPGDEEYSSTDFTGMDQTVGPMQLEIFFMVFDGVFQDDQDFRKVISHCLTANVQVEYLKAWCPTVHGLPSGAGGTNFIETILAVVLHCLAMIIQQAKHRFQVLGDDGASWGQTGLTEALVEAAKLMGFDMNPTKQRTSSTEYVYLQRYFNPAELGKLGAYPTVLALNACVFPERFHDPEMWGPRMESLRWIMILENCKHNPAFKELVTYVREGDKYRLDLGANANELYNSAKKLPGFVPSYNQASANRSLEQFEVMKLLRG